MVVGGMWQVDGVSQIAGGTGRSGGRFAVIDAAASSLHLTLTIPRTATAALLHWHRALEL
jgi:hypothetical protein